MSSEATESDAELSRLLDASLNAVAMEFGRPFCGCDLSIRTLTVPSAFNSPTNCELRFLDAEPLPCGWLEDIDCDIVATVFSSLSFSCIPRT